MKTLTLKALAKSTTVELHLDAKSPYDGSIQPLARLRGADCVGAAASLLVALLKLEVAVQAGRPECSAAACANDTRVWLEACEGAETEALVGMLVRAVAAFEKVGGGK